MFRSNAGRVLWASTFTCCVLALWFPCYVNGAEDETLETVLAAWRKRESATKSVKYVMTEEYLTGKDTAIGGPPRDLVTKMRRVLVLDGGNMRHEREGLVWTGNIDALDHLRTIRVNEGERYKKLNSTKRNDDALHSTGRIEKKQRHIDTKNACLAPILWHFRPLSSKFEVFNFTAIRIVSLKELIDGSRCILLEERTTVPGRVLRYWVAPDKDMSVVRHVMAQGDKVRMQTDVTFKRHPQHGWLPSQWKTIRFKSKDGETFSAANLAVIESEINGPVPFGTFDIEFPPGAEVFDLTSKKRYIVKPDRGQRRVMQREVERGATYTQLVNSEEGSLRESPPSEFWAKMRRFAMIGAVIVTVSLLAVFGGRRNSSGWIRR